jgi:aminoglycoside phosphotransferase family enzyme
LELPDGQQPEIVDYALKMRRMDTDLEMDRMLARGQIDAAYLRVLAQKIANFHRTATVVDNPSQSNPASYAADFNDVLQHAATFEAQLGKEAVQRLQAVVAASDFYLETHAAVIRKRLEDGFVRDVHGDLHTRNIFAYPDPVIFDCIEFNDHFRQIDVLNEVAFFCMDLEANGFDELANIFLAAYTTLFPAMRDKGEELLFTWFKCYRANVRAKVNALHAAQHPSDAAARQEMARYLTLMDRYAATLRAHWQE